MQDGQARSEAIELPGLSLRLAGLDDYSTIRHVHASAIRSLAEGLLEIEDVERSIKAIYSIPYVTELAEKRLYVALLNGELVATCAWSPSDDRGQSARIGALFVLPLFQGAGIATRLIERVEQDAAEHGYTAFTAIVPVSLAPVVERLGYRTASFGTSRDVVPATALQVAFMRKPG